MKNNDLSDLIFISGSFVRSAEYRKNSDIDLICLEKNVGRVYSESFIADNVRFQITFIPVYKLVDVIASDVMTMDRIYVNLLELSVPTDENCAEILKEIKDYIDYMKMQCNKVKDAHVYSHLVHIRELCSEISDERNNATVIAADLFKTLLSFVTGLPNTTSKHIGRVIAGNSIAEKICEEYMESVTNKDYTEFATMALSVISPYIAKDWKNSTGISYNLSPEPYLTVFIPGSKSRKSSVRSIIAKFELCCKGTLFYSFYVGDNQFMECGTYLHILNDREVSTARELLERLYDCHRKLSGICIREDVKIIFPYRTSFDTGYMFGGRAIFSTLHPFFCEIYTIFVNSNETGIALGLAVCNLWKIQCTDGSALLKKYMDSLALDAVDPNSVYNLVQAGYMKVALQEYYGNVVAVNFPHVDTAVFGSLVSALAGIFNSVRQIDENDVQIIRILFHGSKKDAVLFNILNHILSVFGLDTDEKYAVVYHCLKHDNK